MDENRKKVLNDFFNRNGHRPRQPMVFFPQRGFAFYKLRIHRDARHRADLYALRFVKVANAFGAFVGVNLVDFFAHVNSLVRAFGLAHVAVDAFVSD